MYHFLPLLLLCWRMWLWVEWEKWGLMQIKDKSHLYKLQQLDPHVHKCVSICLWGPTACLHLESNWHSGIVKPGVVKWGPKSVCNKLELYLTTWCFLDWPHPGNTWPVFACATRGATGGGFRFARQKPSMSVPLCQTLSFDTMPLCCCFTWQVRFVTSDTSWCWWNRDCLSSDEMCGSN